MVGVPVAFALITVGFVGIAVAMGWGAAIGMLIPLPFHVAGQYAYTPMPLFIFMASLIFAAGFGGGMYGAAAKWLSKLRGGLGIATTGASTVFGTLTGSSLVTAAMFIKVAVPEMLKHKYDSSFAHGLTCSSGVIGMLIPPSMLAILYGVLAEESIGKLFMAGVGPGLLTALAFSLLIFVMVKRNPKLAPPTTETFTWGDRFASLRGVWAVLLVAVVMLGGIYVGIFTVTEGGAIGAFSIFIVAVASRKMSWKIMRWVSMDTVRTNAMIFVLLIGATLFSRFVTITGVTYQFVSLITESGLPEWGVMAGLMGMYILLGCFLDPVSILCITLPLVLPLGEAYGWNSIYFAMLVLYTMHIGTITPPVGLTLFASKGAAEADVSFADIVKGTVPFVTLMVFLLVILVVFKPFTIGLARWM